MTTHRDILDRLPIVVSAIGLAVLCFLLGSATVTFRLFPYNCLVRPSLETLEGIDDVWSSVPRDSPLGTHLWADSPFQDEGVAVRTERALFGYTFVASADLAGGRLVDLDGNAIHTWEAPFREIWPDASHVDNLPAADYIYWEDAELFSDGSVLAVYAAADRQPRGLGLAKIGPDSEPVWRLPVRATRDVTVAPDGSIYVLTRRLASPTNEVAGQLGIDDERALLDGVAAVSSSGEQTNQIELARAVVRSGHDDLLGSASTDTDRRDLDATNLAVAGPEFAESNSFVDRGDLVVSLAGLDTLVVLNPSRAEVTWTHRGPWEHPTALDLRPDGDIVLLETAAAGGVTGSSRVIRYDPTARTIEWSYTGSSEKPLATSRFGTQTVLANGNVLITDADDGRVLEIVPGGGIVWSYVQRSRREYDGDSFRPAAFAADRIRRSELDFQPASR